MRVLLTGGSGFIGRNFQHLLPAPFEVLAPSHRTLDLLDGSMVRRWLEENHPDAIVHGATTPGHRNAPPDPNLAEKNLRMFLHLFEGERFWGRMIVLGSGLAYDTRSLSPKVREEELGQSVPEDPSGLSKLVCARLGRGNPRVVNLLPFGVFGPHEDWEIRFISNAICKVLYDLPVTLRQNRRFDYVWVGDLVRVVQHFLVAPRWEHDAYNVTSDASVELLDLARLVLEVCGKDLPVLVTQEGLGPEYSGDNSRLKTEIPDLAFRPVREAVSELVAWYRLRIGSIRREALLTDK